MKTKILKVLLLVLAISTVLVSTVSFAANAKEVEIVKTTTGDYAIYVQDVTGSSFQYALSDKDNLAMDSIELSYVTSVADGDGNYIAVTDDTTKTNLYVKADADYILALDFNAAILESEIANVANQLGSIETTTEQIETKNETEGKVTHIEKVGALKITNDGDYEYVIMRMPATDYTNIKTYANEAKNASNMIDKIKASRNLVNAFNKVINDANTSNMWQTVVNKTIMQPSDAENGVEYAVLIKKVTPAGTTYDVKYLTSSKVVENTTLEEVEVVTRTTTKLPVTFDWTISLIIALVVIIILVAVLLVVRKKVSDKEAK